MSNLTPNLKTKLSKPRLPLDYANSDDPAEIDNGIRDTIKGIRLSILAMGIGLAKVKSKRLFINLKFKSMEMYINDLAKTHKLESSAIKKWLKIGEAYIKYESELESIGFCDSDGPTKLPYLERALTVRDEQEVFDNLKNMSVRDFKNFSKGGAKPAAADMPFVKNKGSVIYIGGQRAVIINKNLNEHTTAYIQKIVKTACEALENRGVIVPIFVRNMKDGRKFQRAAERLKVKMGLG